jgi:hypothetical protein
MTTQGSPTLVAEVGQRPARTDGEGGTVRTETKEEGVVRIGFNNINGFGASTNDSKNVELYGFMKEADFDIFGIAETNIHWHNSRLQPKDITYGWFHRLHISQKYYKEYPTTANHQVGGVMQLAIGDISCKVTSQGGDESGQGRWTWHSLAGKTQRVIRIITAY